MGNLSGLTVGNTTFPVLANGGGGGDMPIHVTLPKSASDASPSGLAMLAWPNGMRYVYCTAAPSTSGDTTGFIPPEYMGSGSVHITDKASCITSAVRASNVFNSIGVSIVGNSVIGDSVSGATVTMSRSLAGAASTSGVFLATEPAKTSILFFVNPN